MKNLGKAIRAVLFLIVCFICMSVISKILVYEHEMEPDLTMKEFYNVEENDVQMLVVGSSHTGLGFSPIECYKQHKITSYNLSTAKQPVELTYHLLIEGLKTQSPEVIVYDVANLFYEDSSVSTARLRYVLDAMPLSVNKIKLAGCYSNYDSKEKIFSVAEALCPIYYYHNRWKEVDEEDFNVYEDTSYLKGQFMRTYIKEVNYNVEKIESKLAKKIEANEDSKPTISKRNMDYFLKIKNLCDENNMKLILITTPTVRWNSVKNEVIEELCKTYELDFVDMNKPDGEIVDYSTDMADGNHLNAYGAKKATAYLCNYIVERYGITGIASADYDESVKYYDAYDNVLKYQMETDFTEYLTLLNENKEDLAIFISANGEMTAGLQKSDVALLQSLGCQITFDNSYKGFSYVAVIDGGKLIKESSQEGTIWYNYIMDNGSTVDICSQGSLAGNTSTINVDIKEYAINSSGLNIVVYDKKSNTVLDSVAFNTGIEENSWYRSDDRELELFMFKAYRDWVLENY